MHINPVRAVSHLLLKIYAELFYCFFSFIISFGSKLNPSNKKDDDSCSDTTSLNHGKQLVATLFNKMANMAGDKKLVFLKEIDFKSYKLMIRPFVITDIKMALGIWEHKEKDIIKVKKNDVFVDVGAYIGIFSIPAAKIVGPNGKVLIFEPDPKNFEVLQKSVELNKFENVVLYNKAVVDRQKKIKFFLREDSVASTAYFNEEKTLKHFNEVPHYLLTEIEIDGIDLDSAIFQLELTRVDWLKIDAEGVEIDVLNGASKTLDKFSPKIVIEIFDFNYEKVKKILKSKGYNLEHVDTMNYLATKHKK